MYRIRKSITSDLAHAMISAAEAKAHELGVAVNIAIVDESGHLKAFSRMDGAPILSIEIAVNKAYTAVAFGLPTQEWYGLIKDEPSLLYGITHTPRLVIFAGGYPIRVDGEIIGGIGVSGGTLEQDIACAQAALAVLASRKGGGEER